MSRAGALALALLVAGCFSDPGPIQASAESSGSADATASTTALTATTDVTGATATSTSSSASSTSSASATTSSSSSSSSSTSLDSTTTPVDTTAAATTTTGGLADLDALCTDLCGKQLACGQMVDETCVELCVTNLAASPPECIAAYVDLAECALPLACQAIAESCRGPANQVTIACQECTSSVKVDLQSCKAEFACTGGVYTMVCTGLGCICSVNGQETGVCPEPDSCALDDAALLDLAISCCNWNP